MRLMLASSRGLLGGFVIALTLPLLSDPHTIAAWSAVGLGNHARLGLAAGEILGAALFAFESGVIWGSALLIAAFAVGATLHVRHGEMPWWLAVYALMAAVLLYLTLRTERRSALA